MHIVQKPTVSKVEKRTCEFHKKHPGGNFPGCTCMISFSVREKTFEEMTEEERDWYFAALRGEKTDGSPLY